MASTRVEAGRPGPEFLSAGEVAQRLGILRANVKKDTGLKGKKANGYWWYGKSEVEQLAQQRGVKSQPEEQPKRKYSRKPKAEGRTFQFCPHCGCNLRVIAAALEAAKGL